MKKILLSITIAILFLTSGIYANAETQTIEEEGTTVVGVNAVITPAFEVILPNSIDITERKVKEVDVTVKGHPRRTETLHITLPETISMTDTSRDVDLGIAIDQNVFNYNELTAENGTTTKCRIDASVLPSGDWTGSLAFDIQLKDYELPEGLEYKQYIFVFKLTNDKYRIYTSDAPFTYNASNGSIGNNTGYVTGMIHYTEQEDGSYSNYAGQATELCVSVSAQVKEFIYSNYDILDKDTGAVFFAKTTFD